MSRARSYTLVVRGPLPECAGLYLEPGQVLTLDRTAAEPLTMHGVAVSPEDYLAVVMALHSRHIEAEPASDHRGAQVVMQNVRYQALGYRTANCQTLAGSAAAVRAALKRLADPAAVLPHEPSGAEFLRDRRRPA